MSYLHLPRLVFSGDFLSDVSTVNNDPAHYNNETFKKSFQEFGTGGTNGWWNPEGGAVFDFRDCSVQRLFSKDGTITDSGELIGELISGAEGRATGKMVDLDPQQQGVSQLWAVKLRIITRKGDLLLEGNIEPTAFRDLQYRQTGGASVNGQPLGGTWTSVLTHLKWGENADRFLFFKELRETTEDNKLSVNLNGFGYYYNHAPDGRFSLGRILGAIGPYFSGEPETFVAERRLYGIANKSAVSGRSRVFFSNTNFLVEEKKKRVTFDFGASFPVADALGTISLDEELILGVSHAPLSDGISRGSVEIAAADFTPLGHLTYERRKDWLMNTGGIIAIGQLTDDVLEELREHQVILVSKQFDNTYHLVARESIGGFLLRADQFVQRLDTDQKNQVDLYARKFGQPVSGYVAMDMQPATAITPVGPQNPISEIPGNNYPRDGVQFDTRIRLDSGHAILHLKGNRIENPRGYIDGQIYFLDYTLIEENADGSLETIPADPAEGAMSNDSLSIHLRDYFKIPDKPVWQDIAVTMTQFSNLYPIMSKYLVDLSNPEAVKSRAEILRFAFSQNLNDPMYMPVTRDLSENKRLTILKWLENPVTEDQEKESITAASPSAGDPQLMKSPAEEGALLTEKQKRLKRAMQAKSGKAIDMDPINQLKF